MRLEKLKMCLDCDEVFEDGDRCPVCAGAAWIWLSRWVAPIRVQPKELEKAA